MLHAFLLSFGVIFVAELGDKSQLMALAFATRYKTVPVLIAITLATGIVHLFSVALGGAIGTALPTKLIGIIGAIAFVGFGIWTLRGDELTEEDKESTKVSSKHIIMAVGTVFFLAELGDKTMLATVTLATTEGLVGTWAGSTVGMVVADGLAIAVGKALGDRLQAKTVRIASSIAFFVFAAVMFADALR